MGHQHISDIDASFYLAWFVLALSFLMTVSSNKSESYNSKWRAQFFYAAVLHEDNTDGNNGNSASNFEPSFHELNTALRKYSEATQGVIKQLSMSHEVALRTEQLLFYRQQLDSNSTTDPSSKFLSRDIERKISKVAELLEQNSFLLESLLKPFPVNVGLSTFTNTEFGSSSNAFDAANKAGAGSLHFMSETVEPIQELARYIPPYKPESKSDESNFGLEDQSYEDASQIIAHITRDWTISGAHIRQMTYDWIVEKLWDYHRQLDGSAKENRLKDRSILSPILVPGAGMGRLAFDIAFCKDEFTTQKNLSDHAAKTKQYYRPFEVEAVDSSIVMATAAYHLLNNASQGKIYPFVMDPFTNEVNTEHRWEEIPFPEQNVLSNLKHANNQFSHGMEFINEPTLSYTIGDFVTTYASKAKNQMYGAIATCFFIDTATNIYEYILTIKNLLRHRGPESGGGLWINVGPVQWHRNAQLQPSVNELRQIIELFGFEIHHWEVEDRPIGYRHPDDVVSTTTEARFTRSEGYRPLKFVATYEGNDEADDLLLLIEKLRLSTGRKPMLQRTWEVQT